MVYKLSSFSEDMIMILYSVSLWLSIQNDQTGPSVTFGIKTCNKNSQDLNPGPLDSKPTALPLRDHTSNHTVFYTLTLTTGLI